MTMLGRGKKKAAQEKAQEQAAQEEPAQEGAELEESALEEDSTAADGVEDFQEGGGPEEGQEDDAAAVQAEAKLIQAKAELAKAEAELAKARLAEAEAELARAEKAAKTREKAKAKSYRVTTIEAGPAAEVAAAEPHEPMSRGRLVGVVGGLAVVVVLLAVTAIVLLLKKGEQDSREAAGRDAVTVAAAAAQDFSSYDYRSLDSSFKTAMNEATGEWLKQYQQLAQQIRQTASQSQVVVVGTVLKTGVELVSPSRVVAVVFLNQQTSKAGQDRGYDQYRLRLTLVKQQGRWLVANLQAL